MESSLVTLQKTERLSGRGGEKSTERVIVSPTMTTELSFWQIILPSHVARSSPNSKKSPQEVSTRTARAQSHGAARCLNREAVSRRIGFMSMIIVLWLTADWPERPPSPG